MMVDRMKSIIWLGLIKGIHTCLASRRTTWGETTTTATSSSDWITTSSSSTGRSYIRVGRLDLAGRDYYDTDTDNDDDDSFGILKGLRRFAANRQKQQQQHHYLQYDDFLGDAFRPLDVGPSLTASSSSSSLSATRPVSSIRTKILTRRRDRRNSNNDNVQELEEQQEQEETDTSTSTTTASIDPIELSIRVSQPILAESIWEEMTGKEFENHDTVNRLARTGLEMALQDGKSNRWIQWTPHKDTEKLLQQQQQQHKSTLEQEYELVKDGTTILMYVGTAKQEGFGDHLPIIKSKSILPLSAKAMADLLMDSSQVKTYNKLSVGRTDVKILNENTKIVCNLTKPPIAKTKMVSITLMHSRPLGAQDYDLLLSSKTSSKTKTQQQQGDEEPPKEHVKGYLVVSRAVPGMIDDKLKDLPRNDILLGVNVLQDIGPNQCMMTAVTHVYSPALPTMLAKKMGVSSAINFVKDIRDAACVSSSSTTTKTKITSSSGEEEESEFE